MLLSEYFIFANALTASLRIMLDKVLLTSCTTSVAFEKGFDDTPPFKMDLLMMWMADEDGTNMFCAFVPHKNTQRYLIILTLTLTLTGNLVYPVYLSCHLYLSGMYNRPHRFGCY